MLWGLKKKDPRRIGCKLCRFLCKCRLLRNALQTLSDKQHPRVHILLLLTVKKIPEAPRSCTSSSCTQAKDRRAGCSHTVNIAIPTPLTPAEATASAVMLFLVPVAEEGNMFACQTLTGAGFHTR